MWWRREEEADCWLQNQQEVSLTDYDTLQQLYFTCYVSANIFVQKQSTAMW